MWHATKLGGNSSHRIYYSENFAESKFGAKDVNTVKSTTKSVPVSKSSRILEREHSKANRLQNTIECKTNEQSIKYSNWNVQIEIKPSKVSTYSFWFYLFVLSF